MGVSSKASKDALREAIMRLPAQSPPKGQKSNFENPENIYGLTKGILIAGIVLATLMVAAKFYAQIRIVKKIHLEDWFFLLSWAIFAFAFQPVALLIGELPIGIHQWNTHMREFTNHLFLWYCALIIYGIIILFLKITLCLQIVRTFVPAGLRTFTFWASHIMIWTNVVFYIIFTFLLMFCCTPRAKFWDKTILDGHCMDFLSLHVAGAVICLFSDLALLLLPQRVIFSLRLPLKKKIGLSFLFTVGIFAVVASAVRLYYHIYLWQTRTDYTFTLGKIGIWALLQEISGFLVAGLPIFPKVYGHLSKKPWAIRLESSVRSFLHITVVKVTQVSAKVTTIGGGNPNKNSDRRMVSDAEFNELVNKTDNTSFSTIVARSEARSEKDVPYQDPTQSPRGRDDMV